MSAEFERQLIVATQQGLPVCARPYAALAKQLNSDETTVINTLQSMLNNGQIRRIAAVPNHYQLGYHYNGMTVWDIADDEVHIIGARVAALPAVSHCYQRPRALPAWPYNLFAMVHARTEAEMHAQVQQVADVIGSACRAHQVLKSTRILKKTGLRLQE